MKQTGYGVNELSKALDRLRNVATNKYIGEFTDYGLLLLVSEILAITSRETLDEIIPTLSDESVYIYNPPPPPPPRTWKEQVEFWKANIESYYKSSYWRSIREKCLKTTTMCTMCQNDNDLIIHHLNYDNIGNEILSNLMVLCRSCHSKIHNQKR